VGERLAVIEDFLSSTSTESPDPVYPVTRKIIESGKNHSAVDAYRAYYRLKALQKITGKVWRDVDFMITPTCGTAYTIQQVLDDPVRTNSNLGFYTNFLNLLDLCAIAVPAGIRNSNGVPFGVTIVAQPCTEKLLCDVGARFHMRTTSCTDHKQNVVVPESEAKASNDECRS